MNRKEMSAYAESLILDAEEMRDRIEAKQPKRLALARLILADTVEVFNIITTTQMTKKDRMRIVALLVRANLNSMALENPVQ